MSADLGWVDDRSEAGFVAGFLQSANTCGRVFTAILWGYIAQRFGYRVSLLLVLASIAIGGVAFGLATELVPAVLFRFIFLGLGNGWVTMFAAAAADVAGASRQTEVTGIIMASGSCTQLLGPAIGGWTYGLVEDYPAAVPSMVGTFLAISTFALCWCWMPSANSKAQESSGPQSQQMVAKGTSSTPALALSWPLVLVLAMRTINGFCVFALFEVVPLWAITSRDLGGLDFSEEDIGAFLSRSAVWQVFYFSYVMPRVSKRLGLRKFALVASCTAVVCCALLPFSTNYIVANLLQMVAASTIISVGAMNMAFTTNLVEPEQRIQANGLAVTFETLAKALGPMGIAPLFAWSLQTWGKPGHSFVFLILSVMNILMCFGAVCLPNSVETSRAYQTLAEVRLEPDLEPVKLGSSASVSTMAGISTVTSSDSLDCYEFDQGDENIVVI